MLALPLADLFYSTAPNGRVLLHAMPQTSAVRSFQTPKLEPGRSYFYTLKADVVRDGRTVSASKRVTVEAGKEATVEFSDLLVQQARR